MPTWKLLARRDPPQKCAYGCDCSKGSQLTNQNRYRMPTRLTPPFMLRGPAVPARTAARATGRGLSTTPALATQLGG
jgi:hypothetical protein